MLPSPLPNSFWLHQLRSCNIFVTGRSTHNDNFMADIGFLVDITMADIIQLHLNASMFNTPRLPNLSVDDYGTYNMYIEVFRIGQGCGDPWSHLGRIWAYGWHSGSERTCRWMSCFLCHAIWSGVFKVVITCQTFMCSHSVAASLKYFIGGTNGLAAAMPATINDIAVAILLHKLLQNGAALFPGDAAHVLSNARASAKKVCYIRGIFARSPCFFVMGIFKFLLCFSLKFRLFVLFVMEILKLALCSPRKYSRSRYVCHGSIRALLLFAMDTHSSSPYV